MAKRIIGCSISGEPCYMVTVVEFATGSPPLRLQQDAAESAGESTPANSPSLLTLRELIKSAPYLHASRTFHQLSYDTQDVFPSFVSCDWISWRASNFARNFHTAHVCLVNPKLELLSRIEASRAFYGLSRGSRKK